LEFEEIDAAIAAGATLDNLEKLLAGGYDRNFVATIVAWNRSKGMIQSHMDDYQEKKSKKINRKRRP
jgi:hypothetical protein